MAILTASNVGQSFGAVDLFSGISVSLPNDGKVGLVGPNGVGKTTLLLILAGEAKPSRGTVHHARGRRLGYLPQESANAFAGSHSTVYQEMVALFDDLRQQEAHLRQLEAQMSAGDHSETLFEQYAATLESFELAGGYDYETRIKQTLDGLGFDQDSRHLPLSHLSGGQKTRALLARLLLQQPDLLILDEPTNHLDIEAVQWLENCLRAWDGALLVVSHDRYFLDKVANRIWEMSHSGIEVYRGNYSQYLQQRQERWEQRQEQFQAFRQRLDKELDYIKRNIAGQNTVQAKGKLKRVARELNAYQLGGVQALQNKSWLKLSHELGATSVDWSLSQAMEAFKSLAPPANRPPQLNFRLATAHRSGNVVLRTQGLTIGYPGRPLFQAEDVELWREECAALIGANGSGKTTFLRTIIGQHQPLAGQITLGTSLRLGYFAQAHEELNLANQVIEEIMRHHPMNISEARHYLARYLFRGDDIYKPVGALSGGERGRLALALLALDGANFLLLDEPTNHLDIPAQEVMQEVLEQFPGTILLVSHDRYLIDRLATQIWALQEGQLQVFEGNYQAYLAWQERQAEVRKEVLATRSAVPAAVAANGASALSKNARRVRAESIAAVEEQVHQAEARLAQVAGKLQQASAAQVFDKIQSLSIEYAQVEQHLERLMEQWENALREQ